VASKSAISVRIRIRVGPNPNTRTLFADHPQLTAEYAGYEWCESKQKCLRRWEEYCEDLQGPRKQNAKQ
jgi:hypothetical protein